ncbi:MAG: hypothetical protein ACFFFH_19215 [Candidatus Thorarchaeota archaeon]
MNLLSIISFSLLMIGSIFVFLIAYDLLKTWLKVREEALLHLTLFTTYSGLILFIYNILFLLEVPSVITHNQLAVLGSFYNLFYLELAFFYLTLFSNRRNLLEKYFIVIISIAFITNIILAILGFQELILIVFIFQAITIVLGLYFIIQLYLRIKSSKKYCKSSETIEFIELVEKRSLLAVLVLLIDGTQYLSMWLIDFYISELYYFIGSIVGLGLFIIIYYLVIQLKTKAKSCEITEIINILS